MTASRCTRLSVYIGVACLLLMAPIVIVVILAFSGDGYLRFPPHVVFAALVRDASSAIRAGSARSGRAC